MPDLGRLALPGALGHALCRFLTYKGLTMNREALFNLLDRIEAKHDVRYEIGESFEGVQYIRFDVEEEEVSDEARSYGPQGAQV